MLIFLFNQNGVQWDPKYQRRESEAKQCLVIGDPVNVEDQSESICISQKPRGGEAGGACEIPDELVAPETRGSQED